MQQTMSSRAGLRAAGADVLTRPLLIWALAVVFAVRDLFFIVLAGRRPDPLGFVAAGRQLLHDPSHLYVPAAEALTRLHALPSPGGLEGLFSPPALAYLAAPFSLLPGDLGWIGWTAFDFVAAVCGLVLLQRVAAPRTPLSRASYWLVAAYFPPLFADLSAGQLGGIILGLAVLSIYLEAARPALSGLLTGLAAALKFYPLAMILGPEPRRRVAYAAPALGSFAVLTALSFVPLGWGTPLYYVTRVLLPVQSIDDHDCAFDSTHTLFMRWIGGEPWLLPAAGGGTVAYRSPLDLPILAAALAYGVMAASVVLAVWAARRSGWQPAYGLSLMFALGAILPGHVFPYQFLPLLPVTLLVAVRLVERGSLLPLGLLGLALLLFVRPPCSSVVPNLWTVGALALFGICVWQYRLFGGQTIPSSQRASSVMRSGVQGGS
jgi:glycosyl transferase family 87